MKKICIVAIPRTGTNYLCSLLSQHKDIDSKREIFHNKNHFSIKENEISDFLKMTNTRIAYNKTGEIIDFLSKHPRDLTTYLLKNSKSNILSYKIFPSHLNRSILIKEIINDKNTTFLICKRKPIDSYISREKARLTKMHTKINTTDLLISICFEDYKTWYVQMKEWYEFIEKTIQDNNQKMEIIYYEDFTKKTDLSNLANILEHIRKLNIPIEDIDSIKLSNLQQKQDNNTDYTKKVSNWSEFFNDVSKEKWEDKIEIHF